MREAGSVFASFSGWLCRETRERVCVIFGPPDMSNSQHDFEFGMDLELGRK
jgi:hypothetical protein